MDIIKYAVIPGAVKSYNDESGLIEAFVSITGNVDLQDDVIMPGAYQRTLQKSFDSGKWPKILKQHDRDVWLGKTVDGKEYMPDERGLPSRMPNGCGGLFMKGELTLEDPAAKAVYAHLKKGVIDEFSVGFRIGTKDDGDEDCTYDESGIRRIHTIDPLKEWSAVLWGANTETFPVSVKQYESAYEEWKALTDEEKLEMYYSSVLGPDDEELPLPLLSQKAKWTRAFINNLPDSAFALILPGGKKDSTGRTTPRSLRKLPHHGPSGALDLPHLRNALVRVAQNSRLKSALSHLKAHARKAGVGQSSADHDDDTTEKQLYVPGTSLTEEFVVASVVAARYKQLKELQPKTA